MDIRQRHKLSVLSFRDTLVTLVVLACTITLPNGSAAAQALKIDPADQSIQRTLIVDTKTNGVSFYVKLTASKPISKLAMEADDLKSQSDIVDRSNVRLAQDSSLTANVPSSVLVSVSGLSRPGVYGANLVFHPAGEAPTNDAPRIDLKITVRAKPVLAVVPASPTWNALSCTFLTPCWFGALFTGIEKTQTVAIDNQTPNDVSLTSASLDLRGDKTGLLISGSGMGLVYPHELKPYSFVSLQATPNSTSLEPDRYQGPLRLTASDLDSPVNTLLVLNVRAGPVLAITILVIGIVAGRISQALSTPQFQAAEERRRQIGILQQFAASLLRPDSRAAAAENLARIESMIKLGTPPSEIDSTIANTRTKLQQLAQVDFLQFHGRSLEQAKQKDIEETAHSAVVAITNGDATAIATALNDLRGLVGAAGGLGGAQPKLTDAFAAPRAATRGPLERFLLTLSGASAADPSDRIWRFVKPLLFILLLACLAIIGFYNLYIKNPTFGSDIILDYIGIFLWGLSADIAQRTLQNLPKLG